MNVEKNIETPNKEKGLPVKIFQFNDLPLDFFEELLSLAESFIFNQYKNKIAPALETMQLTMNVHLKNYLGKFMPIQTPNFTTSLLDHEINEFINYVLKKGEKYKVKSDFVN